MYIFYRRHNDKIVKINKLNYRLIKLCRNQSNVTHTTSCNSNRITNQPYEGWLIQTLIRSKTRILSCQLNLEDNKLMTTNRKATRKNLVNS